MFAAVGAVAAARWLLDDARAWLALTTLFVVAACLTKNEGLLSGAATYVALLIVAEGRRRAVLVSALVAGLVYAPWRAHVAIHDVGAPAYDLAQSSQPPLRRPPAGSGARGWRGVASPGDEPVPVRARASPRRRRRGRRAHRRAAKARGLRRCLRVPVVRRADMDLRPRARGGVHLHLDERRSGGRLPRGRADGARAAPVRGGRARACGDAASPADATTGPADSSNPSAAPPAA